MAIRIIKEGKITKFTKTCPDCGCEFEYEAEDLQTDYSLCLTTYPCKFSQYVVCPCCGKHLFHGYISEDPVRYPNIVYTTTGSYDMPDCDKCINKPDPAHLVVGDTPCTWCKKNQPYCTNYSVGGDIKCQTNTKGK